MITTTVADMSCWRPGQNQVIQGTVVVLVACVIVGVYLWLNDQLWKEFVQKVLLK